uniref:Uncharacterized protein n=1 Tax=Salvator merianae TaxID=96440 RepID=A0A8D0C6A8_SALMN
MIKSIVFIFSLNDCCALIFISICFIITALESDHTDARSCCSKLNRWTVYELIGHTTVTVLMFYCIGIHNQWQLKSHMGHDHDYFIHIHLVFHEICSVHHLYHIACCLPCLRTN